MSRRYAFKHIFNHQFLYILKFDRTQPDSLVSIVWNGFIALMIGYFLLSIVQSMAQQKMRDVHAQQAQTQQRRESRRGQMRNKVA